MIIHCTQKLSAKLKSAGHAVSTTPLVSAQCSDSTESSIGSWHANITTIQRRQCVVFCHDQTRFALVLIGATAKELKAIDYWFSDLLVNTLLKAGVDPVLIKSTCQQLPALQFDTACNRSVQGTLNQLIQELEWTVQYDGISVMDLPIYSTCVRLSKRPCRIKGMKESECFWPITEMEALLREVAPT
ncbi:DUF6933 domain-containing protein [Neptuniibacter marinus]|uniref:DUF6933 domain-containing protein n=1 Tax=Neptuniibacter marinus TaxID=1806670 RepID=UPI00082F5447|nr:hypothetical protein [Neptuniibacter marinus]